MTIEAQGHVESVANSINGTIEVTVIVQSDVCGHQITLRVPKPAAAHWLVGRRVTLRAWAWDADDAAAAARGK